MTMYRLAYDETTAIWTLSTSRGLGPHQPVADNADIPAPDDHGAKMWANKLFRASGVRATFWAFSPGGSRPFWYAETEPVTV